MVTYRVLIYRVSIEWSHIECSHRVVTHTLHFVFIFTLFGVSCRDNCRVLYIPGGAGFQLPGLKFPLDPNLYYPPLEPPPPGAKWGLSLRKKSSFEDFCKLQCCCCCCCCCCCGGGGGGECDVWKGTFGKHLDILPHIVRVGSGMLQASWQRLLVAID